MIELRPKIDPVSTEALMIYFATCLKNYCEQKQGTKACNECVFYKKHKGCKLVAAYPEEWGVDE